MKNDLDQLVSNITNSSHFQKLKTIIENNPYHDNESVYDHLIKTYKTAKQALKGTYIKSREAKKEFENFLKAPVGNITMHDALALTALLHDIGKILVYEDSGKQVSINSLKPDGKTQCAGHEYLGSTILETFVNDIPLDETAKKHITSGIRLHDTFNETYFHTKENWPIEILVSDVKARAEGLHKEMLFNIYCDCSTAKPFQFALPLIETLFNQPELYAERKYFVI